MKPGSVIIDMAAEMGGNVEGTEPGKEVVRHGVTIIGITNLPATMPASATQMYAKNIQTLIKHLVADGALTLDFDDEITRGATITHGGKVDPRGDRQGARHRGRRTARPKPQAEAEAAPAAPETREN